MDGLPVIFVDLNRRDPRAPYRVFASLHRLNGIQLGDQVIASDEEGFQIACVVSIKDHAAGMAALDPIPIQPSPISGDPNVAQVQKHLSRDVDFGDIQSEELPSITAAELVRANNPKGTPKHVSGTQHPHRRHSRQVQHP